jgi:hypothetical protein
MTIKIIAITKLEKLWLPRGKTTGGYSEAIVDLSNKNIPYENLK